MTREERKQYNWNLTHKINIEGKIERQCTQCKEWKDEKEEFYLHNKNKPDKGHCPECKQCSRKRSLKTKWNNIEEVRKKQVIVYSTKLKNDPEFRKKHRDKATKARNRGYYRDYNKRPEVKKRGYGQKRQKKNHTINKQEWIDCKKYFENKCAYCGLPIEEHVIFRKGKLQNIDLHKEHVVEDGKNNLSNCVPACQICNSSKNIKSLNTWYNAVSNANYTYERYHKIYMWLRYDYKKFIKPKKKKHKYIKKSE
jgi:hypothetical protein